MKSGGYLNLNLNERKKMSKIIKPLLDENGQHIRRKLKEGDYYWAEGLKTFIQYKFWTSELEHFVYYMKKMEAEGK